MMPDILFYLTIFATFLTVIAFILCNNTIVITLLNSAFSLFTVIMYLLLDAPDVAMTEAAVSVLTTIFAFYTINHLYKTSFFFKDSLNPALLSITLVIAGLFIYASTDLPEFGSPKFNHYHLQNTFNDIGIPSVVTAILASYRGYDTLLETLVILIGGISILLISDYNIEKSKLEDKLTSTLTRFIAPLVFLFACYIQLHGEISPGGGFQAGTLIAAISILYLMTNKTTFSLNIIKNIAVMGLGIYIITGLFGMIEKLEFLNYAKIGQKFGIILIELGVGITVTSTMLIIYLSLAYANNKPKL